MAGNGQELDYGFEKRQKLYERTELLLGFDSLLNNIIEKGTAMNMAIIRWKKANNVTPSHEIPKEVVQGIADLRIALEAIAYRCGENHFTFNMRLNNLTKFSLRKLERKLQVLEVPESETQAEAPAGDQVLTEEMKEELLKAEAEIKEAAKEAEQEQPVPAAKRRPGRPRKQPVQVPDTEPVTEPLEAKKDKPEGLPGIFARKRVRALF